MRTGLQILSEDLFLLLGSNVEACKFKKSHKLSEVILMQEYYWVVHVVDTTTSTRLVGGGAGDPR